VQQQIPCGEHHSIKLAPDYKIYLTCNYYGGYPYQDSVYNYINTNLSIINGPDNLGGACNLQPFSFSLGGSRTYFGLPNNPDYDLGPLAGSVCDTLVGMPELFSENIGLFIYYNPGWQTAFINANHLKGERYSLQVMDMTGRTTYNEEGSLSSGYFTKNLNCTQFSKGVYIMSLVTKYEKLTKKFIIN